MYIKYVCKIFPFFQLQLPNLDILNKEDIWTLSNIPLLEGYLSVMDEDPLQEVVKAVIGQYKLYVQPKISSFQKGKKENKSA